MELRSMMNLAMRIHRLTVRDLAAKLGVDAGYISRPPNDPKFWMMVRLAKLIGWDLNTLGDILSRPKEPSRASDSLEELKERCRSMYAIGDYSSMHPVADAVLGVANQPDDRAFAYNMKYAADEALGQYPLAAGWCQDGLAEVGVSRAWRMHLLSNLANARFCEGNTDEAIPLANKVIDDYASIEEPATDDQQTVAYAHYVLGQAFTQQMREAGGNAVEFADQALRHLSRAKRFHKRVLRAYPARSWMEAIVQTCCFAKLEAGAMLGMISAKEAISTIMKALDAATDLDSLTAPRGQRLETLGWACIYGANIAIQHYKDTKEKHLAVSTFGGKAMDIATAIGNWAMVERSFCIEFDRREVIRTETGFSIPWELDSEDLSMVTQIVSRSRRLRRVGLAILQDLR